MYHVHPSIIFGVLVCLCVDCDFVPASLTNFCIGGIREGSASILRILHPCHVVHTLRSSLSLFFEQLGHTPSAFMSFFFWNQSKVDTSTHSSQSKHCTQCIPVKRDHRSALWVGI